MSSPSLLAGTVPRYYFSQATPTWNGGREEWVKSEKGSLGTVA